MSITIGLDVGGAHLKVAVVEAGRPRHVVQIACPLWQGLQHLDAAFDTAAPLTRHADTVAVTMTGELSDLFSDRAHGVTTLVGKVVERFGDACRFWMGQSGFGSAAEAIALPVDVGSTNFLATAAFVATRLQDALLIDFGSTTTDILAIRNGAPMAQGLTDAERLATGELVYTGLTRTAVMGVATSADFQGRHQGLARECLATMADVRRILGDLPDGVDLHATADGRGKSVAESTARLARMFGRDAADGSASDWRAAAAAIAEAQMRSIKEGCEAVISRAALADTALVVVAGIGAGIVAEGITRPSNREAVFFGDLARAEADAVDSATHCAPAVAVALLQ